MSKNITIKAADPKQYDSGEVDWKQRGSEDSPTRVHFRTHLESVLHPDSLKDKKVLDIGSGVGQLFNFLKQKGAIEVVGIDPSTRNVQASTELYPWVRSVCSTLEDFAKSTDEVFDVAVAILVFEHIVDLDSAFADVQKLLKPEGKFYLFVGDRDYQIAEDKTLRRNLVSVEIVNDLGDGAVETKTVKNRPEGISVLYDIFRPVEHFIHAAEKNGFKLVTHKPIPGLAGGPSQDVISCHVFEFGSVK